MTTEEKIREALDTYHDNIITIWERGEHHKDDYQRRAEEYENQALTQIMDCIKQPYISKYKDFEDYLQEKHAEQYVGTDDCMIDDLNDWLQDLGADELIEYADKYAKKIMSCMPKEVSNDEIDKMTLQVMLSNEDWINLPDFYIKPLVREVFHNLITGGR